jgi:protein O-GlcNAc transferase
MPTPMPTLMTTLLPNIALHGLLMEAGELVRNKRALEAVKLLRSRNKAVIAEPYGCFVFALAHEALGEYTKALQFYDLLFKSVPDHLDALLNAANIHRSLFNLDRALALAACAVAAHPNDARTYICQSQILSAQRHHAEALTAVDRAIAIKPDALALTMRGSCLVELGRLKEGLEAQQEAARREPANTTVQTVALFGANYDESLSAVDLFSKYTAFAQRFETPLLKERKPWRNTREPQRRLKIGYLSPDFRGHVVGKFIEPVLAQHDRRNCHITCLSTEAIVDDSTKRMQRHVDQWRFLRPSDDLAADGIRHDQIDILVDLASHTTGSRLMIFARKPAPIQATWLGTGYTTGLTSIDYFLGSKEQTPPGCEIYFSEKPVHLPVIVPLAEPRQTPDVSPLPARSNGYISFGCLSRIIRLNEGVIDVWAQILNAVPASRLILDQLNFEEAAARTNFLALFAKHGVSADRLVLRNSKPFWNSYHDIDIALDPFPHNAGTTTYDALWMGVPVISLRDRPSLGRFGDAILTPAGLSDWVTDTRDDYIARAVAAAGDLETLQDLRAGMRARLRASPLMDVAGFTRALEAAYRAMWIEWCGKTAVA